MTIDFASVSSIVQGVLTILVPVWIIMLILSLLFNWLFSGIVRGRM